MHFLLKSDSNECRNAFPSLVLSCYLMKVTIKKKKHKCRNACLSTKFFEFGTWIGKVDVHQEQICICFPLSSSTVSVLSEGTSCNTYGLLIVALQQQVSFIFFFFFFFFIFLFLFFALKFSLIGIELMKNMHFTALGL